MNLDDTATDLSEERLRFIQHKGREIFLVNFSHCSAAEIMLLIE